MAVFQTTSTSLWALPFKLRQIYGDKVPKYFSKYSAITCLPSENVYLILRLSHRSQISANIQKKSKLKTTDSKHITNQRNQINQFPLPNEVITKTCLHNADPLNPTFI